MVARTAKFIGSAYSTGSSISLEVQYNNSIVYSGNIAATTQDPLPLISPTDVIPDSLFTFVTDTDITGEIPVTITVTGGTLFFYHVQMNYTANCVVNLEDWLNPTNPPTWVLTPVAPVDHFENPSTSTSETDNITNTTKNGIAWPWRNSATGAGDWCYPVYSNDTFSFDFFVDPAKVVFDTYVGPTGILLPPPAP